MRKPNWKAETIVSLFSNSTRDLTMNLANSVRDIYVWLMPDKRKTLSYYNLLW
jgi:hypothetical protein